MNEDLTGYLHPGYAESLSEFGVPRQLLHSRGWILQRQIPASDFKDAMGCYPIFSCPDWSGLYQDLEDLRSQLITIAIVTDPLGDYSHEYLRDCFRDVVVPYKQHFVTDLSRPRESFVNPHHRRNVAKALRSVEVLECEKPLEFLNDWTDLYRTLVERHGITGIQAFSREAFAKQLSVPGLVAFRAARGKVTTGMVLWYVQDNKAYYHLGAYSPLGYEVGASFALFDFSINYFARQGVEWLSLGAGAGMAENEKSGLARFKGGWSTDVRQVYFCGRIFDPASYARIGETANSLPTNHFPAYRAGEFR